MTELEREALADGFRILLLRTWSDPGRNVLAFQADLFDGGRLRRSQRGAVPFYFAPDAASLEPLRALLREVLPAPHVLAVLGRGWAESLRQCFPNLLDEFRVLDLQRAAARLTHSPERTPPEELAGALGLGVMVAEGDPLSSLPEDLLWAVLGRAGEQALSWPDLLRFSTEPGPAVPFEQYDFSRETIAALPDAPGVYVMRDAADTVLYVGKAASLNRRLADYFRASAAIPPKLQRLRESIRRLEFHLVGSELEALLVENRLITELAPSVNVQRAIMPGTSRYRPNASPVVVICPSVANARRELFLFGVRPQALQVRANPARPSPRLLEDLVLFYCSVRERLRHWPHLTVWDEAGSEICHRYWARAKDRLHWLELGLGQPAHLVVQELATAVRTVRRSDDEPAEFRLDG